MYLWDFAPPCGNLRAGWRLAAANRSPRVGPPGLVEDEQQRAFTHESPGGAAPTGSMKS
jgi:hypothetical protein